MEQLQNLLEAEKPFVFIMSGIVSIEMTLSQGEYSIASDRIYLSDGSNLRLPLDQFQYDDDQCAWISHIDGAELRLEGLNE